MGKENEINRGAENVRLSSDADTDRRPASTLDDIELKDPFDHIAEKSELNELKKISKTIQERAVSFAGVPDAKTRKQLDKVRLLLAKIQSFVDITTEPKYSDLKEIIEGDNVDFTLFMGYKIGLCAIYRNFVKTLPSGAGKLEGERLAEIDQFLKAGEVMVKFGGVRMIDLVSNKATEPSQVLEYYAKVREMMIEPFVTGTGEVNFVPYMAEQDGQLQKQFPASTKSMIFIAATAAIELAIIDPQKLEKYARKGMPTELAAQYAIQLVSRINAVREKMFKMLAEPDETSENKAFAEKMEVYLDRKTTKLTALSTARVTQSNESIKLLYRQADVFIQRNFRRELYKKIQEAIVAYIDSPWQRSNLVTLDDLQAVVDIEKTLENTDQELSWESLRKMALEAHQLAPKFGVYTIVPPDKEISWGQLIRPDAVQVRIDPRYPLNFEVNLTWGAENSLRVTLHFDVKKQTFDWNALENPFSDASSSIRKVFATVVPQMLALCKTQAEEIKRQEKESRLLKKAQQVVMPDQTKKREHTVDEVYNLRKELRKDERSGRLADAQVITKSPDFKSALDQLVQREIVVPEGKTIEEYIQDFSTADKEAVFTAIDEFNATGRGLFKKLSSRLQGFYSLRVYTDSGQIRVVCARSKTEKGHVVYTIDRIVQRGNLMKGL